MIQTTIESIDPTGQQVSPAPDLRERVERAAALLESELEPVKTLPIDSRWQIVHQPGSQPRVTLDLMSDGIGIRGWQFDTTDLADEAHIRRSLPWLVSSFGRVLSVHFRAGSEKALTELKKFAATPLASAGE